MQFQHARVGPFLQNLPRLENPYLGDAFLRRLLTRLIPNEVMKEVEPELTQFGERIRVELEPLSVECEINPPYLVQTDAWGRRMDSVVTCHAWKTMKDVSAEEGLIAIPYEHTFGEWSRLIQFTKLYLYSPSSGLYTCPLAMTDGAAKTIKELKLSKLDKAFQHLTSRSPKEFWTSGQWMTEKRGGSDVGDGTETVAEKQSDGTYRLYGYKWFSSATDSDMSFTLARIKKPDGEFVKGSTGLSMFFVKTRNDDSSLNNIQVMKLKNKLGTRQLPTGELLLDGTAAELASEPGRGVACISNMLTITRIHNASASVSGMRRIISLSRDYSQRRTCFGRTISQFPLHIDTLAELELQARGGVSLFFEVVRLLGCTESHATEDEKLLLRLLTPIVKLYTGKKCIGVVSEGLESFGGQGYIEDTGIPRILRDAQVTPIWEGTTNILSLDVLRAIGKSKGEVLLAFQRNFSNRLLACKKKAPEVDSEVDKVLNLLAEIIHIAGVGQISEIAAREFSFAIAEITIGSLLLEQATSLQASSSDRTTASRWIQRMGSFADKVEQLVSRGYKESAELVYDGYSKEN